MSHFLNHGIIRSYTIETNYFGYLKESEIYQKKSNKFFFEDERFDIMNMDQKLYQHRVVKKIFQQKEMEALGGNRLDSVFDCLMKEDCLNSQNSK